MRAAARAVLLSWLVLCGLWGGLQPSLGGDLWWSLAAGRHIARTGAVPDTDVLSYTAAGQPWYNQEWLAQVLYWKTYDALGGDGLVVVKLVLVVAFALVLAHLAARRSGSTLLGPSLTGAVLLVWGEHVDLRAQLFTFLGTVVLLSVLDAYRRGVRGAALLPPLVLLLWVNLHYGFIYGLAIVLGYFVVETAKSLLSLPADPLPLARSRRLGWVFLAALAACLVNPQGLDALVFPFDILDTTSPWKQIVEWRPPHLFRDGLPTDFLVALVVQAAVAGIALWRAPRRFDVTDFGVVAVTAAMAFSSRRFVPLFAVVGVPFLARNLATIGAALTEARPAVGRRIARWSAAAAVFGGLAGTASVGTALAVHASDLASDGLFERMTHAERFPVDAARFLEENDVPGRLYNFYPWGGYLAFHLERPIYIDGRAHAVYPPELYWENQKIGGLRPGWRKALRERGVDVVVHMSAYPLSLRLRGEREWVRIYDDGVAAVLVRRTPATQELLDAFARGALAYPDAPGADLFLAELRLRGGDREGARRAVRAVFARHGTRAEAPAAKKMMTEQAATRFTPDPAAIDVVDALGSALVGLEDAPADAPSSPEQPIRPEARVW